MIPGKNVDIVQEDPYATFKNDTFDVVTATSVFEHSSMFWVLANGFFKFWN